MKFPSVITAERTTKAKTSILPTDCWRFGTSCGSMFFAAASGRSERYLNRMRSENIASRTNPKIVSSPAHNDWHYPNLELESMDLAVNYHRWILDLLKQFLG